MSDSDHHQPLVELGFTALEAEIYTFLVSESPATGYRVAKAIRKPAANTYKALEALERKGAIVVDNAGNRLCRAVPPEEILHNLESRFQEQKAKASRLLASLGRSSSDDRLYQLQSRPQVLERARAMLERARFVGVMDAFPDVVLELRDAVDAAHARGVEIVIKTYRSLGIEGPRVIVRPRGHEILDAIPGELISFNIDGAEHLLAFLKNNGDGVHQAFWTGSAIVSYVLYNGLVNEASQAAAMAELEHETTVERLREVFLGLRHLHPASSRGPAYQNLMEHLGKNVTDGAVPQVDSGDRP